ncbi:MAG: tetratricopeptide repeat protein [Treponema sp.]|jgi:tetratricopeptide (TPR) repeat protein|nr:tetratricopeptide repeat protein [Treponema sp.]
MKRVLFLGALLAVLFTACQSFGASAEEYYSIGIAYLEMGKYEEAERWLSRARDADRTRIASEYNLGRIAFETGRYEDAARYFEQVLARDPDNVMALQALAYTRIKTGEIEAAEALYARILVLVPESLDDGYNHALVLFAMEKYEEAEKLLLSRDFVLAENMDLLLLLARTQRVLGKVEAADTYARWLRENDDNRVRFEYAQTLEAGELYAMALEEYQAALAGLSADSKDPSQADVRFNLARVFLIADKENPQGMTELRAALDQGFADREALEALEADDRIPEASRTEIGELLRNLP